MKASALLLAFIALTAVTLVPVDAEIVGATLAGSCYTTYQNALQACTVQMNRCGSGPSCLSTAQVCQAVALNAMNVCTLTPSVTESVAVTPVGSTQDCLDGCDRTEDKCIAVIPRSCSTYVDCNTKMQRQCFAKTKDCKNQCYWSIGAAAGPKSRVHKMLGTSKPVSSSSMVGLIGWWPENTCQSRCQNLEDQKPSSWVKKCYGSCPSCESQCEQLHGSDPVELDGCQFDCRRMERRSPAVGLTPQSCPRICLDLADRWKGQVWRANECDAYDPGSQLAKDCLTWVQNLANGVSDECANCCSTFYSLTHSCKVPPTPTFPGSIKVE